MSHTDSREILLLFEGISKKYPGAGEVLKGVNLSLSRGEAVIIVGPNGSGKTTLLRIASGLTEPSSGRVLLYGRDPRSPRAREALAIVLHTPSVYPELSVRENLEYYIKLRGGSWSDLEYPVKLLGLEGYLDRRVEELSYGWRRRVDVARAFAGRPPLLLIDEPFNGLDPSGRNAVTKLISMQLERGAVLATAPQDDTLEILAKGLDGKLRGYEIRGGRLERIL